MKPKEKYQRPTIEVIHIELEAPVLSGSDIKKGSGWG